MDYFLDEVDKILSYRNFDIKYSCLSHMEEKTLCIGRTLRCNKKTALVENEIDINTNKFNIELMKELGIELDIFINLIKEVSAYKEDYTYIMYKNAVLYEFYKGYEK